MSGCCSKDSIRRLIGDEVLADARIVYAGVPNDSCDPALSLQQITLPFTLAGDQAFRAANAVFPGVCLELCRCRDQQPVALTFRRIVAEIRLEEITLGTSVA